MMLIDLHCDALYKSVTDNISLNEKSLETKLAHNEADRKLQCYAIWCPDDLSADEAEQLFYNAEKRLKQQCTFNGITLIKSGEDVRGKFLSEKNTAFFTVENASALNSKLENVERFATLGVRMMTLTWNGSNCVGGGCLSGENIGLTDFGRTAIAEMEKQKIIVDLSHAGDMLFYEVCELAKKPVVASHSNSRAVTDNPRNLTDEQFKIICNSGGVVGLNFHNAFLNDKPDKANMYDVLRHAEHFLSLGGDNNLSFGCDFDGGTLSQDFKSPHIMEEIFELFLKHGYNEALVNKIFYENALNFFENFDNSQIM